MTNISAKMTSTIRISRSMVLLILAHDARLMLGRGRMRPAAIGSATCMIGCGLAELRPNDAAAGAACTVAGAEYAEYKEP